MQILTNLYRLAISAWLGGAALFTFVLTPTIFKAYARDQAGGIVGLLFPGYFRWGLACGAVALLCQFLGKARAARLAVPILLAMMAITAAQAFVIEPRAAELKQAIPSFATTPKDDPLRIQFRKLHGVSAVSNLAVIAGGVILVCLF